MITYQSELKTNSFYIIKSCCELIVPKTETEPGRIFISYPVDIDYSIQKRSGAKTFRVLMEISINYPAKIPGYAIMVEGMGDFAIESDRELTAPERDHLINYTAIEACIEHIRGYVANITSQYPLGKYIFAGINMEALYKSKLEQQKKIKTSESKLKHTEK
ncbi:MAG: hypothetical protein RR212_09980 [Bacteroidales bacterium]